MLIHALSDYYSLLSKEGKVLPEGYSKVKIHCLIALTQEGAVDEIINCQKTELVQAGRGKARERQVPSEFLMPQRTEKTGIEANFIEHRPAYIFGLNLDKGELTPRDRTDKALKSHAALVETNLAMTEGLDSPLVMAYRAFLKSWQPEKETENPLLKGLGKLYAQAGFAFCLSGNPERLLHEDAQLLARWETLSRAEHTEGESSVRAQCAVSGQVDTIARIHNKIKGVAGGLSTGGVLVGFNNSSENSYGREQAFNSNISENVMRQYTEALNYLLGSRQHRFILDELTVVFWAMNSGGACESLFQRMLMLQTEMVDERELEQMIQGLLSDGSRLLLNPERLQLKDKVEPNVDFYMLGLKPNSSRISVKFFYRCRYAQLLHNIARFQQDIQVSKDFKAVPLYRIKKELLSPASSTEKVNTALISRLLEAVIYGRALPGMLLETVIRRAKTDNGEYRLNSVRVGIIRACLNREKEEFGVGLDKNNQNQAYLCGRLFAVLEKLQLESAGNTLNRTIKDVYFASASSRPVLVFPKLLRLAQNHLNKVKYPVYYQKLLEEVLGALEREFSENFCLKDQGRFMIGYYQQVQSFYEKSDKTNGAEG